MRWAIAAVLLLLAGCIAEAPSPVAEEIVPVEGGEETIEASPDVPAENPPAVHGEESPEPLEIEVIAPEEGLQCGETFEEHCAEGGQKFALVVSGFDDEMFLLDAQNFYQFLKEEGYSDEEITYLAAREGMEGSDGYSSKEEVLAAIDVLAEEAGCCDSIIIYYSGHGLYKECWLFENKETAERRWVNKFNELEGGWDSWDYLGESDSFFKMAVSPDVRCGYYGEDEAGWLWTFELEPYLDELRSCNITIILASCYSGLGADEFAGPGRTVITESNSTQAWMVRVENNQYGLPVGSVFTNFMLDSLRNGSSWTGAFSYANSRTSEEIAEWGAEPQEGMWVSGGECCCIPLNSGNE